MADDKLDAALLLGSDDAPVLVARAEALQRAEEMLRPAIRAVSAGCRRRRGRK